MKLKAEKVGGGPGPNAAEAIASGQVVLDLPPGFAQTLSSTSIDLMLCPHVRVWNELARA